MTMDVALGRKDRRRNRTRRRLAARTLTILLILALAATAVYFITLYPRNVTRLAYPVLYREMIEKYAKQYKLDSAHVAAVVYCESSYVPTATSSVGARGLMQIMPGTGTWIAEKLRESATYTVDKLYEPEVSIRYGCWYLNFLSTRYSGDFRKITAAYHAGQGTVDAWLKDETYSKDGISLHAIPAGATNQYVKDVASVYEKYKELYAD